MSTPLADAFDEARRGLWRSAAESFDAAAGTVEEAAELSLAAAICELKRGATDTAILRLETATSLARARGRNRLRRDWLQVVARLRGDDPLGAERICHRLPAPFEYHARAAVHFQQAEYAAGFTQLCRAMGYPKRTN